MFISCSICSTEVTEEESRRKETLIILVLLFVQLGSFGTWQCYGKLSKVLGNVKYGKLSKVLSCLPECPLLFSFIKR